MSFFEDIYSLSIMGSAPATRYVKIDISSDDSHSEVGMVDSYFKTEASTAHELHNRLCERTLMATQINITMHVAGRTDVQILAPVRSDADVDAMWDVATRLSQDISISRWNAGQPDRNRFECVCGPEYPPLA